MRILGDGFAPGASVLVVLCIGSIVTFMAGNIHSLLIMSGRSGWAAVNKIVVLALNIVGNIIFIPRAEWSLQPSCGRCAWSLTPQWPPFRSRDSSA